MRREEGAATLEFALVLPLLIFILLLVVDFGRLFYVATSLNGASQEAARVSSFRLSGSEVTLVAEATMSNSLKVASASSNPAVLGVTRTICTGTPSKTSVKLSVEFRWITPVYLFQRFNQTVSDSRTLTAEGVRVCPG